MNDLRLTVRSLLRRPTFALAAIVTMALGVGSTTAVFSVVNAVLLRRLPYANAGRLVLLWNDLRARNVQNFPFSGPAYVDLLTGTSSFSSIGGLNPFQATFAKGSELPEQINALAVTPNLLTVLGVRVALGRDFTASDALAPQSAALTGTTTGQVSALPSMLIISDAYWRRHFGADPQLLGASVTFAGGPATIVGVLPPEFRMLFPPAIGVNPTPDVLVAQRVDYASAPRLTPAVRLIGLLKPGVTVAAASQDVELVAAAARKQFPIIGTANSHYRVEPMRDALVANIKFGVVAVMVAAALMLLISCANLASLLIMRGVNRERELTIRAAIGGSSRQLSAHVFAESVVLATGGGVVGVVLAYFGLGAVLAVAPSNLPRLDEIRVDGASLAFTLVATTIAALSCGLFPAIHASRPRLVDVLRSSSRSTSTRDANRLRRLIIVGEIALTFALLVAGGLMARSLRTLFRTDPGFDVTGVLTFAVSPRPTASPDERRAFMTSLQERLQALPGVEAVTAASPLPLDGGISMVRWGPEQALNDASLFQQADLHVILPGYFRAMHSRVLAGREFDDADNRPEFLGIVIDSLLAAQAFGAVNPVGQRIYVRTRGPDAEGLTIIGVVSHQRHESLAEIGRPALFVPDRFLGAGTARRWAVRLQCTNGRSCDATQIAPAVRRVATEIDPMSPVSAMEPMSSFLDRARAETRFILILLAFFAGTATITAAVGLYGILAGAVGQRTTEFGIRMAHGATSMSVTTLVIREGLTLTLCGLLVGGAAALLATRGLRSILVGVRASDPSTYVGAALAFAALTTLACWIPARRAGSLDPAVALRAE